jgi:hypothetical protein
VKKDIVVKMSAAINGRPMSQLLPNVAREIKGNDAKERPILRARKQLDLKMLESSERRISRTRCSIAFSQLYILII